MNRGARWATVHGITKSWTRLSDYNTHTHTHTYFNTSISLLIFDYIFGQSFPILNMILEQAGGLKKKKKKPESHTQSQIV